MQSTNIRQIKTALVDQAFFRSARVSCAIGVVVAVRRRKGQILALIRGWGVRWYPVECVFIEYAGCRLLS
ncbi:MAG TPA: hypothetical protein VFV38_30885 [Ktedonobacteraceae bacterium]|nr:hypothetical protein [Ktedonobacteraceae bacterium]